MNPKIRGLLWEEYRSGLQIALVAFGVFVLLLTSMAVQVAISDYAWRMYSDIAVTFAILTPLLAAILLTLNISNTGHMGIGFSDRLLRLPVETSTAVLVALCTRTAAVLTMGLSITALCHAATGDGPLFATSIVVTELYVVLQTLAWMRRSAPLIAGAGLLALVVMLFYLYLSSGSENPLADLNNNVRLFGARRSLLWASTLLFAITFPLASVVSIWAANRSRRGAHVKSIPFDAFPEMFSAIVGLREMRLKSPFAAQVWFETRQIGVYLPLLTVGFWLAMVGAMSAAGYWDSGEMGEESKRVFLLEYLPFAATVMAMFPWATLVVARQGRMRGASGFPHLFPVTSQTLACARLTAAGISIIATLCLLTVISANSQLFGALGFGEELVREISGGSLSVREATTILISLPLFTAMVCWIILGLVTRKGFGLLTIYAIALSVNFLLPPNFPEEKTWQMQVTMVSLCVYGTVLYISCLLLVSWWNGFVSKSALVGVLVAWTAMAFMLWPMGVTCLPWEREQRAWLAVLSIAYAALLVLPYIAHVRMVHRRRHENAPKCNPSQHRSNLSTSYVVWCFSACLAGIWLIWQSEPKVYSKLRSGGLPVTFAQLNGWYISDGADRRTAAFFESEAAKIAAVENEWRSKQQDLSWHNRSTTEPQASWKQANIAVFGALKYEPGEKFDREVWEETREYYSAVTANVLPIVFNLANSSSQSFRYSGNARYLMFTQNIQDVRTMARHLSLEALIASLDGNSTRGVDAILAIQRLAWILDHEPTLIAQLIRIATLGISIGAAEDTVNRCQLSDEDLERLMLSMRDALPAVSQRRIMGTGMLGERVFAYTFIDVNSFERVLQFNELGDTSSIPNLVVQSNKAHRTIILMPLPLSQLLLNTARERLLYSVASSQSVNFGVSISLAGVIDWPNGREKSALFENPGDLADFERFLKTTDIVKARTNFAEIFSASIMKAYAAEWRIRTQLDVARTALAVERYRLANGRLPESLDALVPAYIEQIPRDFWNKGNPLKYRVFEDGAFVVYSLSKNGTDEGGVNERDGKELSFWHEGDITFRIQSPAMRARDQVAAE